MIVLVYPVGDLPFTKDIDGSLKSMQALVGGYIERVVLRDGIDLWCNEEGKLLNLPPNQFYGDDMICGQFFVARSNRDGKLVNLNSYDIKFARNVLR